VGKCDLFVSPKRKTLMKARGEAVRTQAVSGKNFWISKRRSGAGGLRGEKNPKDRSTRFSGRFSRAKLIQLEAGRRGGP